MLARDLQAAIVPGVLTALGLMFLNLLLWDWEPLTSRWGRLVCYVVGCSAIWLGFGGWAWAVGEEWALAAWLVLGLLNAMAGIGVGAMWLWHAQRTNLAEQDPALAPHGRIAHD